ncbi:DNA-directed RNA polymerase subunit H [Natronomonas moolapensis 8.8.11]|uniref:DNA-directed RNA polymerase subunit Rpo5 n=1 Tax=Natronomonas moolapensis (strain DSM 18674 / CECT 7526 / JCM 14361 / 8.8.11) TaxID=268739 RepID=M1XLM0_NATM8|nr:DNA-directed RNA polymerase subunit H [Natronomonas moolapensis]CCQ37958.1 DNA-directed RNA polymerase subunit H [Natronomonas moolapensis 8.8.11]
MVDVSQHNQVPEHTVLDRDSVEELLAEYDIRRTDLPKIQRRDAALPEDAEVGDVIKIVRDSRTTDEAIVYRLVVE